MVKFVPNTSMGISIVEAMRCGTSLPLEMRPMLDQPERLNKAFVRAGAGSVILETRGTAA